MRPTPPGWPRLSSALFYRDPVRAIDWLCEAFGFELRLKVEGEGGEIVHSELLFGDAVVMVAAERSLAHPEATWRRSPLSIDGGNTQSLMLYVDDVQAHHQRARGAGAGIVTEMRTTDYGPEYWEDRGYEASDLEGHRWWFLQRLRDPQT